MKLSVSNIAWDKAEEQEIFEILSASGITGIEMAPTKIWPAWKGATPEKAEEVRKSYESNGFKIPALQAILFDKPDLQVFGDEGTQLQLIEHLNQVSLLAKAFEANVLVFGSPKNRDPGILTKQQAFSKAVDFFQRAGDVCEKSNIQLCLEPNPSVYSCSFMTHWYEVFEMVNAVNKPAIKVHLDTACIFLEDDSVVDAINKCENRIAHFHITEPNLGDFSKPVLDHAKIGQALRDTHYDGWLSIEMRRSDNPIKSVKEAVLKVLEWYG